MTASSFAVFLSSTWQDLADIRDVAARAIALMDGHHCIRMESFGARDHSSLDACLQKVAESDIYVGVFGHRYGSCPAGSTVSFTEAEYEEAVRLNRPRLVFLFDGPINIAHIESDDERQRQVALRGRVMRERVCGRFKDAKELSELVVASLANLRIRRQWEGGDKSVLLFPFVTSQADFNTGLAISNVGKGPGSGNLRFGVIRLYFYGRIGTDPVVKELETPPLPPGHTFVMTLASGSSGPFGTVAAIQNFQGYVYAVCNFRHARGYASISHTDGIRATQGYLAEVLPEDYTPQE